MRVDSHQVPKIYFQHLIHKLNAQVNAVRDMPHKAQPAYKSLSRKLSYKMYDIEQFWSALEEQHAVNFEEEIVYSGNEPSQTNEPSSLTAAEEIEKAKLRARLPPQARKRPSSKSTLIVGLGEGRATREIELIWWPDLYSISQYGRLVVRMYIEKCDF